MPAVNIIGTINTLLQIVTQTGLSWSALSDRIAAVWAEGRVFSKADLLAVADETDAALARLRKTIDVLPDDL